MMVMFIFARAQEVFLVENIHSAEHERMMHLKSVVFVRPTRSNIQSVLCYYAIPCLFIITGTDQQARVSNE